MTKKRDLLKQEAEKAIERLREMEELVKQAEIEETAILEESHFQIDEICKNNNLFCGVILSPDDLAAIVKMAIESKENIKIPFNLYFIDN